MICSKRRISDWISDDDLAARVMHDEIDDTARWVVDRYVEEALPTRMDDPDQLLDDAGLDPVTDSWTRTGPQAQNEVGAKRVGQAGHDRKARF